MAKKNGTGGLVKTGANIIANLNEWNLDRAVGKVTGRAFNEDLEQAAAGARTIMGSMKGFLDTDDTNGQVTLVEGAIVALDLYPSGEATGDTYDAIAEALIDTIKYGASIDNYAPFEATFHANTVPVASVVA